MVRASALAILYRPVFPESKFISLKNDVNVAISAPIHRAQYHVQVGKKNPPSDGGLIGRVTDLRVSIIIVEHFPVTSDAVHEL